MPPAVVRAPESSTRRPRGLPSAFAQVRDAEQRDERWALLDSAHVGWFARDNTRRHGLLD